MRWRRGFVMNDWRKKVYCEPSESEVLGSAA